MTGMKILTTKGLLDEEQLVKKTGIDEDARAKVSWVEYWLDGELVHRSAHIDLKQLPVQSAQGQL